MKKHFIISLFIITSIALSSCSDSEIVKGNYQGKFYGADTIDATAVVTNINDGYISIEVSSDLMVPAYLENAQLFKNNTEAYNLLLSNAVGDTLLTGYYFEGFLSITSHDHGYLFQGTKEL